MRFKRFIVNFTILDFVWKPVFKVMKYNKHNRSEQIDYERCKTDFVYFTTHCLIDGRTGKLFKWSSAQIELMRRLCAKAQKGE